MTNDLIFITYMYYQYIKHYLFYINNDLCIILTLTAF